MSLLTALGYYMQGQGQAKRQARQDASSNAYQQGQLGLEKQRVGIEQQGADERKRLDDVSLTQTQQGNEQATRSRQFESGLQLPAHWTKLNPQEQYNYLGVRYSKALQAGDTAAAKATLDQMNSIPRAGNEFANTQYTQQGKTPLAEAQAGYYRNRLSTDLQKAKMEVQGRMQIADAQTRARMAAAGLSARTRLQASGMGNDEREYIATMTALNAANRQDSSQAFNEAMAQYKQASSQWEAQQKEYYSSGQAPPGFDPSAPPTPQQFTVNIPAMNAQPNVVVVPITLPDGTVRKVPMVAPRRTDAHASNGGGNPGRLPIAQEIARGRARRKDDETIRARLIQEGYPQAEIDKGLPQAPAPQNWLRNLLPPF